MARIRAAAKRRRCVRIGARYLLLCILMIVAVFGAAGFFVEALRVSNATGEETAARIPDDIADAAMPGETLEIATSGIPASADVVAANPMERPAATGNTEIPTPAPYPTVAVGTLSQPLPTSPPLTETRPYTVFAGGQSLKIGEGEPVTLPLSGLVIGIDPGHQSSGNSEQEPIAPGSSETKAKVSTGTQGTVTGTPEYVVNLVIAKQLRDMLTALGADVVMTRTVNDVNISNIERAQMMNKAGADLVLRLHCNGSSDPSDNGIGLYVNATGPIAEESQAAAALLLETMTEATGARAAGVYRRDTYTGLNWSEVPCILVEMGYMSHVSESILLENGEYQQRLVTGMTNGIARYFSREIG